MVNDTKNKSLRKSAASRDFQDTAALPFHHPGCTSASAEAIRQSFWLGTEGLPTVPFKGANSFSKPIQSISLANKQSSCSGLIKLVSIVLNISNWGCYGNFFNMICRFLIKFNQKPHTIHNFKKFKSLTIWLLTIIKNQLTSYDLTGTTQDSAKVGDVVTLEGMVTWIKTSVPVISMTSCSKMWRWRNRIGVSISWPCHRSVKTIRTIR